MSAQRALLVDGVRKTFPVSVLSARLVSGAIQIQGNARHAPLVPIAVQGLTVAPLVLGAPIACPSLQVALNVCLVNGVMRDLVSARYALLVHSLALRTARARLVLQEPTAARALRVAHAVFLEHSASRVQMNARSVQMAHSSPRLTDNVSSAHQARGATNQPQSASSAQWEPTEQRARAVVGCVHRAPGAAKVLTNARSVKLGRLAHP